MLSKRIIVIGLASLVICGICGLFSAVVLFSWKVYNPALIENANSFMEDLQNANHESAYWAASQEMRDAMNKTKFVEQFALKNITEWHFDDPSLFIADVVRGNITVDGKQYRIALKFTGSDLGIVFGGYDFGELGQGGIPIS